MIFRFAATTVVTTAAGALIGEVVSYGFGVPTRSMIEVSHLGSTMEGKIPGIMKGTQVTLECNYNAGDTGHSLMKTACASTVVQGLLIGFTDAVGTKLIVEGYVSGYNVSGGLNDKNKLSVTFDVINVATWGTYAV